MKIPEDKNERMKFFAIIGAGVVVVLGIIVFLEMKMSSDMKKVMADIEDVDKKLKKTNSEIDLMKRDKIDNLAVVTEMKDISDKYLLGSVLGNYQLVAKDIVAKLVKDQSVTIDPIREVGQFEVPGKTFVRGYAARVTLKCGYHDLLKFLRRIEASNPFLAVTSVSIMSKGKEEPDNQDVTFEIQWPIWTDPEMPAKLEAQLKEARGDTADAGAK